MEESLRQLSPADDQWQKRFACVLSCDRKYSAANEDVRPASKIDETPSDLKASGIGPDSTLWSRLFRFEA